MPQESPWSDQLSMYKWYPMIYNETSLKGPHIYKDMSLYDTTILMIYSEPSEETTYLKRPVSIDHNKFSWYTVKPRIKTHIYIHVSIYHKNPQDKL